MDDMPDAPWRRGCLMASAKRGLMDKVEFNAGFKTVSRCLAMSTALIAAVALIGGWLAGLAPLRDFGLGYPMQANTVLGILSAGLSLWLLQPDVPTGWRRRIGAALALFTLSLGALTLLEHASGWDLGLDQAFVREPDPAADPHPGQMAPNIALALFLLGLGLLLLAWGKPQRLTDKLALTVIVLELLAIFGHSYGASEFYRISWHAPQTLPGSWAFMLLGWGLLFARPHQGLMATLASDGAGGILLRRMLPVAILLPPLIVKLRLTGQNLGLYNAAFGITLFVTLLIVIFSAFIWSSATLLRKVDTQRRQALAELREINRNLDALVAERTQTLACTNADLSRQISERTQAEARFRGLFEAAPDAIVIVDGAGMILQTNPQAQRWFGYPPHELQGQPVEMLLPPAQRAAHRAHLQGYMAMPLRQSMAPGLHPHGQRKDGSTFPVSITLSPFEIDGRALVIAMIRDISEQAQMQRERLELADRHRDLLENLPVGVCHYALDADTRLLEINRTAAELLEADSVEALLPYPLARFLKNPQDLEPLHETLLSQNTIQHAEVEFVTLRGRSFWAGLSLRLKMTPAGRLYCSATFRDISERKQIFARIEELNAELERHATELAAANTVLTQEARMRAQMQRRLSGMLESAPDSIIVTDEAGLMVQVNAQVERWFGYARTELLGQPVELLVPARLRSRHAAHREAYLRAPRVRPMGADMQLCGQRKDGSEFLIEASLSPFVEEDRHYVITIIRDVTEPRRLQQERLQLNTRYQLLVENLPLGICRYIPNERGEYLEANAAMARIFDADSPETFMRHATASQLAVDSDEVIQFTAILRERGTVNNHEVRIVSLKGRRLWCNINAQLIRDDQGHEYVYAVIEDITQRKQAELRILELNRTLELRRAELEAANQELEAFSYSVSHDLRAPLRAIDGFSQAVLEDYQERLDDTGQNYLQRLRMAAQRMGHLIDDMLQLSRITRADLAVTTVDLTALARQIAGELAQREPQRRVDFDISPDLRAPGDPQLLRIALTNLFENAWKFTARRDPAIIRFGARDEDQGRIYVVEDNGVGFDMAYVDKLFHAFQRLHDAHEFPGTGIGLAIVQRVIHKHGGRIWAQAKPDGGATFSFSLEPIIKSI